MYSRNATVALRFLIILCLPILYVAAQEKPVPSTPDPSVSNIVTQDPIRISVEEVRIPIAASDIGGRFDPTVGIADVLVREDGVVQQLESIYRIPASVMLLLDTGGELNPVKDVRLTREVAVRLVSSLRRGDQIAVLQVNSRVELAQSWTTDQSEVITNLRSKLLSGKRSVLAKGMAAAVDHLQKTPAGNRHIVLISDGIDSPGVEVEMSEAVKSLTAANITVHIISYTSLGRRAAEPRVTRPRLKSNVPEEIIMTLPRTKMPGDPRPDMRDILRAKGGTVVDLERLMRRGKDIKGELERREREFEELTEETGGGLWLPASAKEMLGQAEEVAREIGSQYVVTYKPLRPLGQGQVGEYRKIDVIPRRAGLRVRSRRGYVAKAAG